LPTLNSRRTMEHSAMPVVAHSTKWTVVVDSQRVASTLMLCGSKAEADAEFVRLRESGVRTSMSYHRSRPGPLTRCEGSITYCDWACTGCPGRLVAALCSAAGGSFLALFVPARVRRPARAAEGQG
jgi:hypothetical protein